MEDIIKGYKEELLENESYLELVDAFLEINVDEETKNALKSILEEGKIDDYNPDSELCKNNSIIETQRRLGLACLLLNNPDTFEYIRNHNILFYHGTTSKALNSILSSGKIKSIKSLLDANISIETGETWSRKEYDPRDFISFTDVLEIAEDYSTYGIEEGFFPIVFGINKETAINSAYRSIKSDVPEIGITKDISLEDIGLIIVPSDKVSYVSQLVQGKVKVLGLSVDDIVNRFYYIDYGSPIEISWDRFNEIKEKTENARLSK